MPMLIRCFAALVALAVLAPNAHAQSSVPLVVPTDAPDSGPSTPAVPLVPAEPVPDAGAISAAPLPPPPVVEVPDAGAPVSAPADAGVAPAPAPLATDAGAPAPAPNATAAPAPKPEDVNPSFVKGELSTLLGADRLVDSFNRVGVSIGYNYLDGVHYALVEPQLDLHIKGFNLGLAVPLNIEVLHPHLDANGNFQVTDHPGQIRPQDWATWQQYFRALNYLTYGHKEDRFYLSVGQVYAETLGHGEIMRRYSPNIDINTTRVSAEVDAYNDYAGFEALTNDITRWNLVGILGFVKPLAFVSDDSILRSLSIGATWASDFTAPQALSIQPFPNSGLLGCDCRPKEDGNGNLIIPKRGAVNLGGVDAEIKVVKTHNVDIKPYVDFSKLFGGGEGFTVGALGRFNLGEDPVHAFRLIAEGRYLSSRYKPEYFDTFYEVDKYIYDAGIARPAANYTGKPITNLPPPRTQYEMVTQGAPGFDQDRAGYYLEASYGVRGFLGATLALEGDSTTNRKNFIAHLELPDLWIVQLFASYYKRDMTQASDITSLDTSTIILAGARIKILPILFVNLRAYQSYVFDPVNTHDYLSTQGVEGDVEFGWEF